MHGFPQAPTPAFLFDPDGTLIDSVYQHVAAWRQAWSGMGTDLSVWRVHRRIGMSGGLFVGALLRETGLKLTRERIGELRTHHADAYGQQVHSVKPLPGASELPGELTSRGVPRAIRTGPAQVS
ncbi:HAD family hydrolase [[Actinomadura] parvosata]|uniref:HAD family hydrolase n=1 Tax=[Actinomadura] parvosata TaxID=1955412 RepID=UPI00406CC804